MVIHATRDGTAKTVHKAAARAVHAGRRPSTDSASSARALQGSVHACVKHTQKAYARGNVHEHRAACRFALRKPYLRVWRGVSTTNLAGAGGFLPCLWHLRQDHACEQAALSIQAA